jgi:hypothetical protein
VISAFIFFFFFFYGGDACDLQVRILRSGKCNTLSFEKRKINNKKSNFSLETDLGVVLMFAENMI